MFRNEAFQKASVALSTLRYLFSYHDRPELTPDFQKIGELIKYFKNYELVICAKFNDPFKDDNTIASALEIIKNPDCSNSDMGLLEVPPEMNIAYFDYEEGFQEWEPIFQSDEFIVRYYLFNSLETNDFVVGSVLKIYTEYKNKITPLVNSDKSSEYSDDLINLKSNARNEIMHFLDMNDIQIVDNSLLHMNSLIIMYAPIDHLLDIPYKKVWLDKNGIMINEDMFLYINNFISELIIGGPWKAFIQGFWHYFTECDDHEFNRFIYLPPDETYSIEDIVHFRHMHQHIELFVDAILYSDGKAVVTERIVSLTPPFISIIDYRKRAKLNNVEKFLVDKATKLELSKDPSDRDKGKELQRSLNDNGSEEAIQLLKEVLDNQKIASDMYNSTLNINESIFDNRLTLWQKEKFQECQLALKKADLFFIDDNEHYRSIVNNFSELVNNILTERLTPLIPPQYIKIAESNQNGKKFGVEMGNMYYCIEKYNLELPLNESEFIQEYCKTWYRDYNATKHFNSPFHMSKEKARKFVVQTEKILKILLKMAHNT